VGKLDGKVALVTGGNRGIGKGIARAFAAEGAALIVTARGLAELQRTAQELTGRGTTVLAVPADLTDEVQVHDVFRQTIDRFGRLDILVNNAGAFDGGPLDELSAETWDKVLAINLRAPFLCTREAMRIMKGQGGGRIINIGSISAQRVRPHSAPYSASKHGLWGLTQVTALEGRDFGISCGCLHPGNVLVERRRSSGKKEDDEPMMTPEELAESAVLMASLPPHVNMLEAIMLPVGQLYVGRG
jgi:NAD(P)-dependent dehydrogenase (short-subunit alcohol dehydrogenase family)